MHTTGDLIGSNVLSGIARAVSESIVQMTIADLFFVHQRATMNAVYLVMVNVGTFLATVAAGYAADAQGWRWIWWLTTIFVAVTLVLIVFFYEKSKFTIRIPELRVRLNDEDRISYLQEKDDETEAEVRKIETDTVRPLAAPYPTKSSRERFALLTLTPGGSRSYFGLVWEFVYLLRFPP